MKTKRTAIWILACVMVLFTAFTIGCKNKNDNTAKTVKEITLSDATFTLITPLRRIIPTEVIKSFL